MTTLGLHDEHMTSNASTAITVIGEVFLISLLCKLYPYLLGNKFVSKDFPEVFHSLTLAALLEVSLSSLDTWDWVLWSEGIFGPCTLSRSFCSLLSLDFNQILTYDTLTNYGLETAWYSSSPYSVISFVSCIQISHTFVRTSHRVPR